ncbi:MAG: vitamin B12-dependent ribonucleotide reductase [Nanoarchaeota archaeon]
MRATLESKKGMAIHRQYTQQGRDPLDQVSYEKRLSLITEPDGKIIFEMKDVEIPESWSQLATDILASKYFRKAGVPGTGHETSARQVVHRISHAIRAFGEEQGYFASKEDAACFEDELSHMLITQKGAFNSPVWFNCGLWQEYGIKGTGGNWHYDFSQDKVLQIENSYERPQCSACFIQGVDDDLMSMFDLMKNEARLFKYGSGSGTNFSKIRGKQEKLSGGGISSGLLSFLEVFDRAAGATKSGGTTRRAAKMVCLDMDHPEIIDFIQWKVREEKKAKALIAAGYPADFNGDAYHTVAGQNANNSVRITDEFMNLVLADGKWSTTFRTSGELCETFDAKWVMQQICEAAWHCADPGVQFNTIINNWHTCPNSGKINASNPCSEYMFLDETACNLASLNIMKFLNEDCSFDIEGFRHCCRIFFIAQEILVDFASYPTRSTCQNSYEYRTIGLGYANLGTYLMVNGIPYDSDKARAIAGSITAIMTATAYQTSSALAAIKGAFAHYEKNKEPMLKVMQMHRDAAYKIDVRYCPEELLHACREDWDKVIEAGEAYGFRNAQATVLAPTGTIGLLMDCDTTGIEPEFSLIKWKKLAGGGYFKIINKSMVKALTTLGHTPDEIADIQIYMLGHGTLEGAPFVNPVQLRELGFTERELQDAVSYVSLIKSLDDWTPHINPKTLKEHGLSQSQIQEALIYVGGAQTIEGAPHVKEEDYPVFDCANKNGYGKRFILPMGHVKMMAAVQPFISGAISKTVNIPNNSTVEDIEQIYFEAWRMGLKAVALYRDGCKSSQPLSTGIGEKKEGAIKRGEEEELPAKRKGMTMEAHVGGHKLFLRTGEYEDSRLGEIFIDMNKEDAGYRSVMSCFAIAVSFGLQYGIPLEKFVKAFTFTNFPPQGVTDHEHVKMSSSVLDFIFRVLAIEYLDMHDFAHIKPEKTKERQEYITAHLKQNGRKIMLSGDDALDKHLSSMMGDAPVCNECGHKTVRNGTCYRCLNCGNSMGCS